MTNAEPGCSSVPPSGLSEVVDALLMTLDAAAVRGAEPPTADDLVAAALAFLSYPGSEEFDASVTGIVGRLEPHLRPGPGVAAAAGVAVAEGAVAVGVSVGRHLGPALAICLCLAVELAQLRGITVAQLLAEYIAVEQAGDLTHE